MFKSSSFQYPLALSLLVLLLSGGVFLFQKFQKADALTGPINVGGTDYYVVTSTDPTEDSGIEACAKAGRTCVGYTNFTTDVCTTQHPIATVISNNGSGDKSGVYCDGPPQGGICAGLSNTCTVCPSCAVGVSCSDPIGGLYREMYVECGDLVDDEVVLNAGQTTIEDNQDILVSVPNFFGGTGVYRWIVDGSNLMALNIPFNSGSPQIDFSGNGHNGTPMNGPVYTSSGQVGGFMRFDGMNDYIEDSVSITDVAGLNEGTIEFWYRSTDTTSDFVQIFGLDSGSLANFLYVYIGNATSGFADESVGIAVRKGGVSQLGMWVRNGHSSYKDESWHHFVIVTGDGNNRIYVDGILQAVSFEFGSSLTNEFSDITSPTNLRIMGGFPGSAQYGKGDLDEFRIYPRALSTAQVDHLYADGDDGLGGPTIIDADETVPDEVWNLIVTPITESGLVESPLVAENTVTIVENASSQSDANAEITIDINDFLSFAIENIALGDEAAGDQPFGAGVQITDLVSAGLNDYAISGEFGSPVYTRLQTTTNSADGYNVTAYSSNIDSRTNTLLRIGGTPGNAADEIEDTLTRLSASQVANDTLDTASDTGLAFRLHDTNTSALLREADEDTQWGDDDTTNALWAAFPLGSGAAQIIYDTLQFSEAATTAYINWFVGIDPQQRSGSYSGQVTFAASVN